MDRIWDPFFTTKPTGQGTGLGLSITLRIVARHGGSIHAENLESGGARFTVELPVEGPGGTGVG
jgi:signal transduction histidine kinase